MENGQERHSILSTDPSSRANISLGFGARKYFGKRYAVDNYDLKGSIGANPGEQAFYQLFVDPLTGTDNTNINAIVTITYTAIFSEPNPGASS